VPPLDAGYDPSHTRVLKTAISIPDEVFEQATKAAKRLGLSRSEFVTRAVREYLATRLQANIQASYDAAFPEGSDADTAEFRRRAARQALLDIEWNDE
jgi:Arc/MetJ family transcription regulator